MSRIEEQEQIQLKLEKWVNLFYCAADVFFYPDGKMKLSGFCKYCRLIASVNWALQALLVLLPSDCTTRSVYHSNNQVHIH